MLSCGAAVAASCSTSCLACSACRNRTTYAARYPDKAWDNWLTRYNVTFNSTEEAAYRRQVFGQNLALAVKLNELAGPEVAVSEPSRWVLTWVHACWSADACEVQLHWSVIFACNSLHCTAQTPPSPGNCSALFSKSLHPSGVKIWSWL